MLDSHVPSSCCLSHASGTRAVWPWYHENARCRQGVLTPSSRVLFRSWNLDGRSPSTRIRCSSAGSLSNTRKEPTDIRIGLCLKILQSC
jgi:hypothetical protein